MRDWTQRLLSCACALALATGCNDGSKKMNCSTGSAAPANSSTASAAPAKSSSGMSSSGPPRPAELDRLNAWAGHWSSSGEMIADGKTTKMTGSSSVGWECNKHVLVERATDDMEGMGKSYEIILYSWDDDAKDYKVGFFNSMGEANMGHMKWDAAKNAFTMRGEGKDPMTKQPSLFEMEIRMPDTKTMEFTWTQWDSAHQKKTAEGKGSAHKSWM